MSHPSLADDPTAIRRACLALEEFGVSGLDTRTAMAIDVIRAAEQQPPDWRTASPESLSTKKTVAFRRANGDLILKPRSL